MEMNCGGNNCSSWNLDSKLKVEVTDSDVVETSPDKRYIRYGEILGRGAFKNVYKGFDEVDGVEVAWNQVTVDDALWSPEHLERIYSEVHLLRTLKHENVIRSYASWVDDENKTINIITELFTSGSLRQYRKKHKTVSVKAIKNWARQILRGLRFLHTHNPPVIHRDLKCDNIFVNGNHGEVKIGDLGLAMIMQQPTAKSVIGTPEFMAPELYEEEYNELVDIYSFGMCVLELITCSYPYSECKNEAQIFKKVTSGIKPAALGKVKDPEVKQFIENCLAPVSQRLSAEELLRGPFLSSDDSKDSTRALAQLSDFTPRSKNSTASNSLYMDVDTSFKMLSGCSCPENIVGSSSSIQTFELKRCTERNEFILKGENCDDNSVSFSLRIADFSGGVRNIHFIFYLNADTAVSLAAEMVEQLDLWKDDAEHISEMIDRIVSKLQPNRSLSTGNSNKGNASHLCPGNVHGNEANVQGVSSQLTSLKSSMDRESIGASSEQAEALTFIPDHKKDMAVTDDILVQQYGSSNDKSLTSGSMRNSGTSFAGSWTTTSNDMNCDVSFPSLIEKNNEVYYELKVELEAIDLQYQERCRELMKMRDVAIENAKKKWIMRKH